MKKMIVMLGALISCAGIVFAGQQGNALAEVGYKGLVGGMTAVILCAIAFIIHYIKRRVSGDKKDEQH